MPDSCQSKNAKVWRPNSGRSRPIWIQTCILVFREVFQTAMLAVFPLATKFCISRTEHVVMNISAPQSLQIPSARLPNVASVEGSQLRCGRMLSIGCNFRFFVVSWRSWSTISPRYKKLLSPWESAAEAQAREVFWPILIDEAQGYLPLASKACALLASCRFLSINTWTTCGKKANSHASSKRSLLTKPVNCSAI